MRGARRWRREAERNSPEPALAGGGGLMAGALRATAVPNWPQSPAVSMRLNSRERGARRREVAKKSVVSSPVVSCPGWRWAGDYPTCLQARSILATKSHKKTLVCRPNPHRAYRRAAPPHGRTDNPCDFSWPTLPWSESDRDRIGTRPASRPNPFWPQRGTELAKIGSEFLSLLCLLWQIRWNDPQDRLATKPCNSPEIKRGEREAHGG